MSFTRTYACNSRSHCATCRSDRTWRERVGAPDECPFGQTVEVCRSRSLSDRVRDRRVCKSCPLRVKERRLRRDGGRLARATGCTANAAARCEYSRRINAGGPWPRACPLRVDGVNLGKRNE